MGIFPYVGSPPPKFAYLTPLEKSPIKFLLTLQRRLLPPLNNNVHVITQ